MKLHAILGLALSLAAAACSSGVEPASTTSAPVTSLPAGVELAITQVGFGVDGAVTLTNYGSGPVDLRGAWLGQGLSLFQFPSAVIGPGESLDVRVEESLDADGGVVTGDYIGVGGAVGSLGWTAGEVALFRYGAVDDPEALVSYVQWGSEPGRYASVAGTAGIWDPPSSVPTEPETSSIVANLTPPVAAADWSSS